MVATRIRILMLFLVFSFSPALVHGQEEGVSMKKAEKIQAKKDKDRKKGEKDLEKELRKRHLKMQDKATRKRLKKHDKRADKGGSHRHKDPFFQRLFGSKH